MSEPLDIGFKFIGYNDRRPPFNDPAFRRALSAVIDREAHGGGRLGRQPPYPRTPGSHPRSRSGTAPGIVERVPGGGLGGGKKMLQEAGYAVVDGKLHYPAGVKETTPVFQ